MKIELSSLTAYYRDLYTEFTDFTCKDVFFSVFFNRVFSKIADEQGFSELFRMPDFEKIQDKAYFRDVGDLKRRFKRYLQGNLPKIIEDQQQIHKFNIYFLNESFQCFDRSIYWFLNYYRNLDRYSLHSCIQNFYYSEFFVNASISRYLGLSSTWIPELGKPIKIERTRNAVERPESFEMSLSLKQEIESRTGASHEALYSDIRRFIEQYVNLPISEISDWFQPSWFTSMLKEERENHVYNISHPENNPWNPLNKKKAEDHSNLCFLNGPKLSAYPHDAGEYLQEAYGNWGYQEQLVGNLIHWMASQLGMINAKNEIRDLRSKIEDFDKGLYPEKMKDPIAILLSWLPDP